MCGKRWGHGPFFTTKLIYDWHRLFVKYAFLFTLNYISIFVTNHLNKMSESFAGLPIKLH